MPPCPGAHDAAQAELLARLVAQVADYAIIALDPQGTIVTWNAGAERVTGYSAEQAIGLSCSALCTPEDRASGLAEELLQRAQQEGHVQHQGYRLRRDGRTFWADVTLTALQDAEARPIGFAEVTRDLSAEHDLEERLLESEERLRLLVGQVVDYAIIALDPQGTIETWNLGAERLKGYTQEEAVGRSFAMFYSDDDRRAGLPARLLQTAREHGRVEHTGWRLRRDGSRFWANVTITALHDTDGRLTGYAKVTRDRTDVKRLEDAQDAFYASFTHDFRTPVSVIKGYVEALREAEGQEREELLSRIETGADRLLAMVEGLVDFARQRVEHADLRVADVDLAQVARSAVADLAHTIGTARVHVADTSAPVRAHAEAMHRVVSNLVSNAVKYSGADTEVRIDFARAGDLLEMRVSDTGRGIHPDDLATIFDHFERGRLATDDGGSGLGLASAKELVEQQDGRVEIASTLGEGTVVRVLLPAADRPANQEGGEAQTQPAAGQPSG